MKTKWAKWSDEGRPIIETAFNTGEERKYIINAKIKLSPADMLTPYELRAVVDHMRLIVKAYDANAEYLK